VIILDACVLISFADPSHVHHQRAKRVLSVGEDLAVSVLTGAEIMVEPAKTQRQDQWLDLFAAFEVSLLPLAGEDMADLARLRRQVGVKLPDTVVLQMVRKHGAALATFDERLSTVAAQLGITVVSGTNSD